LYRGGGANQKWCDSSGSGGTTGLLRGSSHEMRSRAEVLLVSSCTPSRTEDRCIASEWFQPIERLPMPETEPLSRLELRPPGA
jgi:hypothetical protein